MSTPDRDQTMRDLARVFSEVSSGQPLDLTVGGVVLFLVAQCEHAGDPELDKYVADKLRQVADVLVPK
jgi:hypothetical protein